MSSQNELDSPAGDHKGKSSRWDNFILNTTTCNRERFWQWVGTDFTIVEEFVKNCDQEKYWLYEDFPERVDQLSPEGWKVIRGMKSLEVQWNSLNNEQRRYVRKLAVQRTRPGKTHYGPSLPAIIARADEEKSVHHLIPVFEAYVYSRSLRGRFSLVIKGGIKGFAIALDDINKNLSKGWNRLKNSPQGLTLAAIMCLLGSFSAFVVSSMSWLYLAVLVLSVLMFFSSFREEKWNYFSIGILFYWIFLLLFGYLFAIKPPGVFVFFLYIPLCSTFLSFFVFITAPSEISSRKRQTTLFVSVVTCFSLALKLIGLEDIFVARFTFILIANLMCLDFLYRAKSNIQPPRPSSPITQLTQREESVKVPPLLSMFLIRITRGVSWQLPFKEWGWPNSVLAGVLFALAVLLFSSLFASETTICDLQKANDQTISISYPSWLSDRDSAFLFVTFPSAAELQDPELKVGSSLWAVASAQKPTQNWTETMTKKWEIYTLYPMDYWNLANWEISFPDAVAKDTQDEPCNISIGRIKLPFGLRNFIETQPFTTLLSLFYGIVQTGVHLWIGVNIFSPDERRENTKIPDEGITTRDMG